MIPAAEKLMDFYNQKFKEAEECLKEMKSQQKEKKLVVKTEPRDSLGESSQAPPPTRKSEPKGLYFPVYFLKKPCNFFYMQFQFLEC